MGKRCCPDDGRSDVTPSGDPASGHNCLTCNTVNGRHGPAFHNHLLQIQPPVQNVLSRHQCTLQTSCGTVKKTTSPTQIALSQLHSTDVPSSDRLATQFTLERKSRTGLGKQRKRICKFLQTARNQPREYNPESQDQSMFHAGRN